ncbi:nucleic acid dioxygenase ALKBH1 [Drosophila kikkawai]|uniref:Nucleic acid dioxygenase ALKBH1 n=1 Tax=Drosophila kikkawai TaxID=30033 RepID=A0A6P4J760_DROKI|nr:nucleic acid dioxygenase ALKBH1 [Drosophila kikkawai]
MFKLIFKQFKAKSSTPDLNDVVNFDKPLKDDKICEHRLNTCHKEDLQRIPGLKSPSTWRCYKLRNHPGIVVIRNPFTERGLRYWISRCLRDYPRPPNIVNLNERLFDETVRSDWWKELQRCQSKEDFQRTKVAMRWTTFGYHHDWDTKHYDDRMQSPFPEDLSRLCRLFASILGYEEFKPEAAIVNYYPVGSSLSGHVDYSEPNQSAPLFSFSFGQTAIFLIGGKSLEETPTALLLQSGDVLIMSGESRLCYHAVPRILKDHKTLNSALPKDEDDSGGDSLDMDLFEQVGNLHFWQPFSDYIADSRININVRQVLKPGQLLLN